MSLYGSCPVCAYPVTSDGRLCPCCKWELESDYTLGRLTTADHQRHKEELQGAHERWRKLQRQHAAERALAAAQARLQHVQHTCVHSRQTVTVATAVDQTDAPTDLMTSPNPDSSASSRPPQLPIPWFRRLWWSLFRPENLAEYYQRQEGR